MDSLKFILEKNYDIQVVDIEKIKNAYRITTNSGEFCFKSSHYDFLQFNFIIDVISYLNKRGFKDILPIYKTINGERYVKTDDGYGFMCEWIDSREVNYENPVELRMCLDTLSSLHLLSRGFTPSEHVKGRINYGKWIKKFEKRCSEMLYFKSLIAEKEKLSEFDSIYEKNFDIFYKQALRCINHLKNSCYLSLMEEHKKLSSVCHHDTANHNFLITPECKIYIIDFDYCIQDSHLHDLSSIIIRNLKYGNWDMDKMNYILECYSKNIPIDDRDIYIISCFMEFPQDFWQVGLQYYVEHQLWKEEFFLKRLGRVVRDMRDRNGFLECLQNSCENIKVN